MAIEPMIHILILALGLITSCKSSNENGLRKSNDTVALQTANPKRAYEWTKILDRNGQFTSQVLRSYDGIHWMEQEAPWSPRGAVASVVHNDRIYITGGKYGGTPDNPKFIYSNDLWVLARKK